MKIFLAVFACAPNSGSEGGVGWRYALKLAEEHQVWAITDTSRRAAIEAVADQIPTNLKFIYFRPAWLEGVDTNANLIYQAWLNGLLPIAQALDREHDFDVCWHLTYGVFRQGSSLWKLNKPFVMGPIGGGERAPFKLLRGMTFKDQVKELTRDFINCVCCFNPQLRNMYRHTAVVIARTEETKKILPRYVQPRTVVQQEIGGVAARRQPSDIRPHSGALNFLFAGRLLAWKGIHFAISAFAQYLAKGGLGTFTIIGQGPMESRLRQQVADLSINEYVKFIPTVSQEQLFELYPTFDLLLFPSLHDSGGNVVIEALSFGLPVVCLDLGGPKCFVNDHCGWIITTACKSTNQVCDALAIALLNAFSNPSVRFNMALAALDRARELIWEEQYNKVLSHVYSALPKK